MRKRDYYEIKSFKSYTNLNSAAKFHFLLSEIIDLIRKEQGIKGFTLFVNSCRYSKKYEGSLTYQQFLAEQGKKNEVASRTNYKRSNLCTYKTQPKDTPKLESIKDNLLINFKNLLSESEAIELSKLLLYQMKKKYGVNQLNTEITENKIKLFSQSITNPQINLELEKIIINIFYIKFFLRRENSCVQLNEDTKEKINSFYKLIKTTFDKMPILNIKAKLFHSIKNLSGESYYYEYYHACSPCQASNVPADASCVCKGAHGADASAHYGHHYTRSCRMICTQRKYM